MHQKFILTLILATFISVKAFANAFNPSVSLIGSYTITNNYHNVRSGIVSIDHRKANLGFEFSNKFYFQESWFFKTGIRYNQYQTTIEGLNQFSNRQNNPPPFFWQRRFESFAVPILIGKEFHTEKGRKADCYLGGSFGVLTSSYLKSGGNSGFWKDPNGEHQIQLTMQETPELSSVYFFPTVDVGGSYYPFRSQRWGFGALLSIQLNSTAPYLYSAWIQNAATGEQYFYQVQHQLQVINCSFLLTYTFGKREGKDRKKYMLDLPKTN